MRIVSFNVNGLRAILGKGFADMFDSLNADAFVIQETKYTEKENEKFPFLPEGYHCYQRTSKGRKGYSGVAIYTKAEPLSVHYGLLDGKYDEEGRVITLEFPSFYLVGAYVPNSGEELKRLPFRIQYEQDLLEYLAFLEKKKPLVYTGDLNVAHEPIDLKNPQANRHNAGFTDEERSMFGNLLSQGYIDTFRYLHPTEVTYSWWSYRFHARDNNAGWRIDYFIISSALLPLLHESTILTDVMGSDHCPVLLEIGL